MIFQIILKSANPIKFGLLKPFLIGLESFQAVVIYAADMKESDDKKYLFSAMNRFFSHNFNDIFHIKNATFSNPTILQWFLEYKQQQQTFTIVTFMPELARFASKEMFELFLELYIFNNDSKYFAVVIEKRDDICGAIAKVDSEKSGLLLAKLDKLSSVVDNNPKLRNGKNTESTDYHGAFFRRETVRPRGEMVPILPSILGL